MLDIIQSGLLYSAIAAGVFTWILVPTFIKAVLDTLDPYDPSWPVLIAAIVAVVVYFGFTVAIVAHFLA